jgi:hypothetical protein
MDFCFKSDSRRPVFGRETRTLSIFGGGVAIARARQRASLAGIAFSASTRSCASLNQAPCSEARRHVIAKTS